MATLLINIDVPHLEPAIAFYTEAFGLQLGRRFGEDGVELLGGQAPIYLLVKPGDSVAAASEPRSYDRHWTPLHLDFVVEALDSAIARAEAAGAQLERAARSYNWGRIALMSDPFGHGFCLVQFVGGGYDEIAT